MESRRLVTTILLAFLIWIGLQQLGHYFAPKQTTPTATAPATQGAGTQPSGAATAPTTQQDVSPVQDKVRNDTIAIGSGKKGSDYRMEAVFSNFGGTLTTLRLNEFSESVKDRNHGYSLISPVDYSFGTQYSLGTEKLFLTTANNQKYTIDLEKVNWFHQVQTVNGDQQVKFWIDIAKEGKNLLRVVKTYTLPKNGYDLSMAITLENLTDQNLNAVLHQEGLVGIRQEDPRSEDRKVLGGTVAPGKTEVHVIATDRAKILKEPDQTKKIGAVDEQPVWTGQTNKYFAALLASVDKEGKISGSNIESIVAKTYSTVPEMGQDITSLWTTKTISLNPKAQTTLNFEIYFGPKSENIFTQPKYEARNYNRIITLETSFCTMQWLADFMTWLLNHLYLITRNYGLAIILMVIIVRVILHPVTKSSQISMMRMQRDMQRLQPKMAAIKQKYKDNREALNKATMELYKEEGINPAAQMMGCLPLMLQMPIWVALWTALNNAFNLRHQPFFLWIKDLAGPDALVHLSQTGIHIPLISGMIGPIHELNILPLLVFASFILQQMFNPQAAPSPDADPAQVKQQKIMMYVMSVFMGLLFYNAPSGLNLYILTSTALGVVESKRIRQHLEAEKNLPPDKRKKSAGWWESLQKKAESLAAEYEKTKKEKK